MNAMHINQHGSINSSKKYATGGFGGAPPQKKKKKRTRGKSTLIGNGGDW